MRLVKSLSILVLLLSALFVSGQNPLFGGGEEEPVADTLEWYQGEHQAEWTAEEDVNDSTHTEQRMSAFMWLTQQQRLIKDKMVDLTDVVLSGHERAMGMLLLLSVLLGMLHALGPGHNKLIVFSYFVNQRPRVMKGILFGLLIAFVHAISGIALAYLVYHGAGWIGEEDAAERVSVLISYVFILLIGLFLFVQNIRNWNSREADSSLARPFKRMLPMALFIGMVPCPATMIWVTYLLINQLSAWAWVAGLFVGLGMSIVLILIALLSILFNATVKAAFASSPKLYTGVANAVSLLSSLLIIGFAVLMLF